MGMGALCPDAARLRQLRGNFKISWSPFSIMLLEYDHKLCFVCLSPGRRSGAGIWKGAGDRGLGVEGGELKGAVLKQ